MTPASGDTSSDDTDFLDRPEHLRIPAKFEVRFHEPEHAQRAFRAWSVNVSAGGLALKVTHEYKLGDRLALSVTVEEETVDVEGVVAWTRNDVIGVRFEPADDATRERLNKLAESFNAK